MHELYKAPEIYDVAFSWDPRIEKRFYKTLLNKLGVPADSSYGRVIEFACGTGRILRMLSEAGFGCFGIDLSLEMSHYAHRKNSPKTTEIVTADMTSAPFKTRSFAAAINTLSSISCLPSLNAVASHLREASRILSSHGVCVIDFLLGKPVRKKEHWRIVRENERYEVFWEVGSISRRRDKFAEKIEVKTGSRVLLSASETTIIGRRDFYLAVSKAGFEVEHWFRPFRKSPLDNVPVRGRMIAVLRKRD